MGETLFAVGARRQRPPLLRPLLGLLFAFANFTVGTAEQLLPAAPDYARNPHCTARALALPPSTHTSVDGDDISPRPSKLPLDQGDAAICFAYATADMISQRVGVEISPLDVATKYYFASPLRLERSANPRLQEHLRRMGDWRAAIEVSRATTEISQDNNPKGLPFIDKLEGGEEEIAALLYNIDGLCRDKDLPSYEGFSHFFGYLSFLRWLVRQSAAVPYTRRSLGGAAPALHNPETDAFNEAWLNRVKHRCRRLPLPTPLLPISFRVATNEASFLEMLDKGQPPSGDQVQHMLAMIDYALDHDRAPAVGYSWYVLEQAAPDEIDLVADHASIVIGRRKVGGSCQYRIQDNTGEYCVRMRPGIRERCDLGRVWLTEEELTHTLYSVTYLR